MITLYRKNALGIGMWSIWNEGNTIHISHSSTLDGAKVHHEEIVTEGKQSRSLDEQVQHRIASRVSKQKDRGYTEDIEKASTQLLNQLGLALPMLAKSYEHKMPKGRVFVQNKLNGLRCLATRQDGEIVLYSRRGKAFAALSHIKKALESILQEGDTFDGELYVHGTSLQTIQSWAKRDQTDSQKIKYIVYDMIDDAPFSERWANLCQIFEGHNEAEVCPINTHEVTDIKQIGRLMDEAREGGFEGVMIRSDVKSYESGKRSASLMKFKEVFDDEGVCRDILLTEKGNPVLVIFWKGKTFRASPPGGLADRIEAYGKKENYIGCRVTFEYRELTDDGIPFHAVATHWRTD